MSDSLAHRGPDGDGVWTDPSRGIALGHRRLAIVDLSPLGRQPMELADGRLVLTYNGEIYNHLELRAELEVGGRSAARPFRYRSPGRSLCPLGRGADRQAPDRHLRLRPVGQGGSAAGAGPRPDRGQAAVLGRDRGRSRRPDVRIGVEGAAGLSGLEPGAGPRRDGVVLPVQLRAGASQHLPGHCQVAARFDADLGAGQGRHRHRALLEHARLRGRHRRASAIRPRRWRNWTGCCATRSGGR